MAESKVAIEVTIKMIYDGKEGNIMMQLYDQEEIMRMHDRGIARDSAIRTAVEMCQDFGMNFKETVEKIAIKFTLSKERSQEEVIEYWKR